MSDQATVARNLEAFRERDRSWNARAKDFIDAHTVDVVVHRPGSREPTRGNRAHWEEMEALWDAFTDVTIGPVGPDGSPRYGTQFGSGDVVCATSVVSGTHDGELNLFGKLIPPTGRRVEITLCTVARFENGKIAEEHLFYDLMLLAKDLGVWPPD
ncbi:ester cyclase [Spirillospora sp. CA-294931]|uniref:ester cyclase n=1 Tax=Spirillospora sp. CA-294931 TaxID=3240042 RepID=UPI003D8B0690